MTQEPDAWLEFPSGQRVNVADMCTMGRAPDNRVVIVAENISRRHAVIRRNNDGSFSIMDMGSSNGTFLNGQRISRTAELRNHWIIEIGSQKMTFRTVPRPSIAPHTTEIVACEAWLLAMAGTRLGCYDPSQEMVDKTNESWGERCQRVIGKFRGQVVRGMGDALLAFWVIEGADSKATVVASALRSLQAIQQHTAQQFRFGLHYGAANVQRTAQGLQKPIGPEVIFATRLDRLASNLNCPLLVTESAKNRLGDFMPLRRLTNAELRDYDGSVTLFTSV